ncbi:MAG TPA: divalent-cation tolerance protein CutA [Longimicrobium sp.]|nr:divalent-cation tolerance protein CutA [Longimicrobium sp.]
MVDAVRVVLMTAPDAETAGRVAHALVNERLIACANLLPGVTSIYRWQGAVQADAEVLVVMKTRDTLVPRLMERAAELHPYQVPELLALEVSDGLPAYCRWVMDETADE